MGHVVDDFRKVEVRQDEFNGLIGNIAGGLIRDRIGGKAGDFIGGIIGGGGANNGGGGGGRGGVGGFIGDLIGGRGKSGGGGGRDHGGGGGGRSGGFNMDDIGGVLGGLVGGGGRRDRDDKGGGGAKSGGIGGIINGIGGLIGGGGDRGRYNGGGPRTDSHYLSGGMCNIIGDLIGEAAHRFLGVNPQTGKIIGAIAGNVIFNLGGKDNKLSDVGKIVLDNIVTGKWRRDVDPYVKPEPRPTPGPPVRTGPAVDFYAARDACIRERHLYEDLEFPANDSSLYFSRRPPKRVTWLRPGEIVREPQLICDGHSRFDVIQGELGDCWLMAAAANLTLRDELFYRVVPPDQSFTENYAGIFHFQFWQYGRWVDVVIDDRLPTSNGELLYMHSRDNSEFWSALLEKAYAKLHGSYEALKGGTTSEALEDMTGGLTEFFDLQQPPENLLSLMMRAMEMGSLFGCSIEADPNVFEARMPNGLVKGHAYSITGMRIVSTQYGRIPLLRIRNPWGNDQEWNGAWSDNSREWRSIPENVKREMGLTFDHDGEFWMSFDDFMHHFEKMEICNLGPDVMEEVYSMTGVKPTNHTWSTNSHDGSWRRGVNAGGCRNNLRTFAMNPQYRIKLTDADPNDDDDLCTVIVAVMQKYRREMKHAGLENLAIGFAIYEANGARGRLSTDFFAQNKSCARSPAFINLREVTGRFRVPPGEYVIIPSTYESDEEADFMIRVFTNGLIDSEQFWNFPSDTARTPPVVMPSRGGFGSHYEQTSYSSQYSEQTSYQPYGDLSPVRPAENFPQPTYANPSPYGQAYQPYATNELSTNTYGQYPANPPSQPYQPYANQASIYQPSAPPGQHGYQPYGAAPPQQNYGANSYQPYQPNTEPQYPPGPGSNNPGFGWNI